MRRETLGRFEPALNTSSGKLVREASAKTAKKCTAHEIFREISLYQFFKVKLCKRFMMNCFIEKATVEKFRLILRISCVYLMVFL